MRVSKEEMVKNRATIIEKAAALFREQGIEKTTVNEVMRAAGLTHGGFYRHFQSKDQLVNAALENLFEQMAGQFEHNIEHNDAEAVVKAFIDHYLSEQHACNPDKGCPISALATETARKPEVFQQTMSKGADRFIQLLALGIKGNDPDKISKATGLMSLLVGCLVMARSAETPDKRAEILAAGRRLALKVIMVAP